MARRNQTLAACVLLVASACSARDAGPTVDAAPVAPQSPPAAAATAPPATSVGVLPTSQEPVALDRLDLWAFPGPDHYEGDVLTFQLPIGGFGVYSIEEMSISVDGVPLDAEPILRGDPLLGDVLVFPNAFHTDGEVGGHWVTVTGLLAPEREIDVTARIVVLPEAGRPRQEISAQWAVEATGCCNVTYLAHSAAARDLDHLVELIDESARRAEEHFGLELPRVDLVLIDRLWGNGGYAGSEVVVSYLDRDFSPGRGSSFRQTVLHEIAHAITDQIEHATPWPLLEGTAVQFAGGHFKPEPLGARARALELAGGLPSIADLFSGFAELQHESRYVAAGALVEYLVETYGFPTFLDVFDSNFDLAGTQWLDAAVGEALGIDLVALQKGFTDWLAAQDPSTQADDLALTIALQEARRAFQAEYDPYPSFFAFSSVTETGEDALAMREPRSPRLVAVEALIGYAQDLIIEGDHDAAAVAVAEVERVVAEGTVGVGLSADFLEVAAALDEAGYELLAYVPGDTWALATRKAPALVRVDWEVVGGAIVVTGIRAA